MATMNSETGARLFPRRTVSPPVSMELVGMAREWGQTIQINCRCVDISSAGVGLTTDSMLHKGEVLKLQFSVIEMQVTLPVLTEVVWVQPVNDQYRVGLQFLG